MSLDDLAATANREHELCEASSRTTLSHALAAGRALILARGRVEPGEWQRWLTGNFKGNIDVARLYLRLATYEDELAPDMGITEAKRFLSGKEAANPTDRPSLYPSETRKAAIALAKQDVPLAEIAKHVAAPPNTVRYWIDPAHQGERIRSTAARARKAREALRREERQKEIRKAVRQAGKALSEAYSMAERMQGVLAQALGEANGQEARDALTEAIRLHHKTRDEIVRALGVSP